MSATEKDWSSMLLRVVKNLNNFVFAGEKIHCFVLLLDEMFQTSYLNEKT